MKVLGYLVEGPMGYRAIMFQDPTWARDYSTYRVIPLVEGTEDVSSRQENSSSESPT